MVECSSPSSRGIEYAEIYSAEEGGNYKAASFHSQGPKISLFSSSSIEITPEYAHLISKERTIFLFNLCIVAVLSPLVFRYAMGANESDHVVWGAGITEIEWTILLVAFFDAFNSILRGLPMISGKPTQVESTKGVSCHGTAVIGNCSPFVAEDEAIFLRGLLGKTCTAFNTCAGRHTIRGLYVDTILNEKRLKGEEHRKAQWLSWMKFINSMIQLCLKIKYRQEQQQQQFHEPPDLSASVHDEHQEQHPPQPNIPRRLSRACTLSKYDDHGYNNHTNIRISRVDMINTTTGGGEGHGASLFGEHSNSQFRNLQMLTRASHAVSDHATAASADLPSLNIRRTMSVYQPNGRPNANSSPSANDETKEDFQPNNSSTPPNSARSNPLHSPSSSPRSASPQLNTSHLSSTPQLNILTKDEILVDVVDIIPLISFLHHWLEVVKDREWTFNYRNTQSALDSIFLSAPFLEIFDEEDIVDVHKLLIEVYDVFTGSPTPDLPDPKSPINGDDLLEIRWILRRNELPDWSIHWQYLSRARLRPLSAEQFRDPTSPPVEYVSTRIKPGTIVYENNILSKSNGKRGTLQPETTGIDILDQFLDSRRHTYKVLDIIGEDAIVIPFPPKLSHTSSATGGGSVGGGHTSSKLQTKTISLQKLKLLEMNRGKAGAMNAYADVLRIKAIQYVIENNLLKFPQIIFGIVDARHMLAEPSIFFNEALPYFSMNEMTGKPLKLFGEHNSSAPMCMLVQYPQYFTNVNHEDYLDNRNAAYYTIWQALRDAGKVCTSSGSNAIWEISNPDFEFATTSRIEDTGTSHKYLTKHTTVSLPCFVAYGIAKKTEDYLEAVYRWSTGAVEIFWCTIFTSQIGHFLLIGLLCALYFFASFYQSSVFYFLWLLFLLAVCVVGNFDSLCGHKPLRPLIVSSIIVVNSTNWIGNLLSVAWVVLIPIQICFFKRLPLSDSLSRALFWMWGSFFLRLPAAFMTDVMCRLVSFLNPHTSQWNYTMVLWRSSQLYACSFAYTFLSVLSGTRSAFNSKFYDADLTMWSSFRVSDSQLTDAWKLVIANPFSATISYLTLWFQSVRADLGKPDVLTRWYAAGIFLLQFICILVSCNVTNKDDTTLIFVTILVCGLNIFLVTDIAMLLFPALGQIFGRPARPEYVFAVISAIVVVSAFAQGGLTGGDVWRYLQLTNKVIP